ncbi:hypothetical protein BS50DRAFT_640410 [Corynespora cassiicola Philippines]|uniref:RanBP2-type domain-containing protein n=1 Tax=Corynespora cassiicola Philippines TaxID=1448308 RepID=A0A2T2N3G7_CORCC|nr:hypothetical protein BS50DRAFT_640410 [Corynespora cassiicola Philippines]
MSAPSDVWICTECGAENLNWVNFCPICSASRSNSTTQPTAPSHQAPPGSSNGSWECPECGASNSSLTNFCPLCGYTQNAVLGGGPLMEHVGAYSAQGLGGGVGCPAAGSPAPGTWYCANCSAANSNLTPDFCPACGQYR